MTRDQAIAAAQRIDREYLAPTGARIQQHEEGIAFMHLRWMVQELAKPDFPEGKTMRWLGYIQGVVVASHVATLEEMKNLSREAAGK